MSPELGRRLDEYVVTLRVAVIACLFGVLAVMVLFLNGHAPLPGPALLLLGTLTAVGLLLGIGQPAGSGRAFLVVLSLVAGVVLLGSLWLLRHHTGLACASPPDLHTGETVIIHHWWTGQLECQFFGSDGILVDRRLLTFGEVIR